MFQLKMQTKKKKKGKQKEEKKHRTRAEKETRIEAQFVREEQQHMIAAQFGDFDQKVSDR
jgi:hypothetical protein